MTDHGGADGSSPSHSRHSATQAELPTAPIARAGALPRPVREAVEEVGQDGGREEPGAFRARGVGEVHGEPAGPERAEDGDLAPALVH